MNPSSGLINLLEHLTELRETFSLLDYWFIVTGYNSGTARWKRCVGQGIGTGCRDPKPSPGTPLSKPLQVLTNPEAL